MVLRKLSQTLKFSLAVLVTVFSSGLMPSAVAYADQPDNVKVFVCKYVGTPFINETLQTGQNPISVSVNSIPNYQGVGSYFADQHGRSFVLSEDNTAPGPAGDPDVSACPQPQNNVTPTAPTVDPLCGPNNDAVTIPTQTGVTYGSTGWVNGSLTVTATAQQGYVLQGQTSWTFTDQNVPCLVTVTPTAPTVDPLCGPNNDIVTLPTQTGVAYSSTGWVNNSLTVAATAQAGYILDGQTSWTFTDQNIACPISVNPAAPTKDDLCELEDDTFTIPSTTGVEYRIGGNAVTAGTHSTNDAQSITVTAHALTGYVLSGTTSWTLTFTNQECESEIIDVCPNIADIQLFVPSGLVKDDNGNCVTDQCPLVPGVQTNTTLCPAGQGGGTTPTTPGQTLGTSTTTTTTPQVLSTSTELPATIPATGGSSNPLMIVLASILAYGVAYLLQGRRQFSRDHA